MNPHVETMLVLQRWVLTGVSASDETRANIAELRARVPAPILAHFDRLRSQGRKGVAEASRGVCGGCHLRLPAAVSARGAIHLDLELCDNCGAYLIFPEAEEVPPVPLPRTRRRYRAAVMA